MTSKKSETPPTGLEKGYEPSPVKYTAPVPLVDKSKEELLHLISEQRRRMNYLAAELDFFKQRVIELEAEELDPDEDWRYDYQ